MRSVQRFAFEKNMPATYSVTVTLRPDVNPLITELPFMGYSLNVKKKKVE